MLIVGSFRSVAGAALANWSAQRKLFASRTAGHSRKKRLNNKHLRHSVLAGIIRLIKRLIFFFPF
jgi:hypothetical protein